MPDRETPTYTVSDNSGSFTGRGWRLSGPTGFMVFSDRDERLAEQVCKFLNSAIAAAIKAERDRAEGLADECRAWRAGWEHDCGNRVGYWHIDGPTRAVTDARARTDAGGFLA